MPIRTQSSNFGRGTAFSHHRHVERYALPMHIHQFAEMVFIRDGEIFVVTDGKTQRAVGGDFIFIQPFRPHRYFSNTVSDFTVYTFSPSLIADFLDMNAGRVGETVVFAASEASKMLFEKRFFEAEDYSPYSIKSCIASMLCDYTSSVRMVNDEGENRHALIKLIEYLTHSLSENPSLPTAASAIGYSANYLSHVIKKSLGFGYLSLLGLLRVEEAKSLLESTKKTSLEISMECGFGSERTFHRQFKKVTGISPSEYRHASGVTVINNDIIWPETIRREARREERREAPQ